MGGKSRTVEERIALIAGGAHGVVTRAELRAAGVTAREIDRRIAKGALIPEYPGVYRAGHRAPSVEARYTAAVKAHGDGALLKGGAAAYLLGILKSPSPPSPEVLTTRDRRVKGVKTTRTRRIERQDVTDYKGIPCTTVPRTLVDLAAVLDEDDLARVCHEAGVKYRITPKQVEAVLARRPNSPGAAKLRAVMSGDVKVSLSALETGFHKRLDEAGLPIPATNKVASGRRVDCRWPGRLTVELDGFRFHNSRHSWEQGNRREREARKRGEEFRRYTYDDVFTDSAYMLAELRDLLT
jgi:hypothetical protein